jgi:hypothetical protein
MNFKSYGTRKTVKQRMARKRMRRDVFLANAKLAKAARKARRLEHKRLLSEELGEE